MPPSRCLNLPRGIDEAAQLRVWSSAPGDTPGSGTAEKTGGHQSGIEAACGRLAVRAADRNPVRPVKAEGRDGIARHHRIFVGIGKAERGSPRATYGGPAISSTSQVKASFGLLVPPFNAPLGLLY